MKTQAIVALARLAHHLQWALPIPARRRNCIGSVPHHTPVQREIVDGTKPKMNAERRAHGPSTRAVLLTEVSDLGGRLEHIVTQYQRMVRGLCGVEDLSHDFDDRLTLANREIAFAARRLQELLVLQFEAAADEVVSERESAEQTRRERRASSAARSRARRSVVEPFLPALHGDRLPAGFDARQLAAAR